MKSNDLHAALRAVVLERVPVCCTDRHVSRKERAALARRLFRSLGLQGLSVTAPHYSMAHAVDVPFRHFKDRFCGKTRSSTIDNCLSLKTQRRLNFSMSRGKKATQPVDREGHLAKLCAEIFAYKHLEATWQRLPDHRG